MHSGYFGVRVRPINVHCAVERDTHSGAMECLSLVIQGAVAALEVVVVFYMSQLQTHSVAPYIIYWWRTRVAATPDSSVIQYNLLAHCQRIYNTQTTVSVLSLSN